MGGGSRTVRVYGSCLGLPHGITPPPQPMWYIQPLLPCSPFPATFHLEESVHGWGLFRVAGLRHWAWTAPPHRTDSFYSYIFSHGKQRGHDGLTGYMAWDAARREGDWHSKAALHCNVSSSLCKCHRGHILSLPLHPYYCKHGCTHTLILDAYVFNFRNRLRNNIAMFFTWGFRIYMFFVFPSSAIIMCKFVHYPFWFKS